MTRFKKERRSKNGPKISKLNGRVLEGFCRKKDESFVVKPSIPIIWFGDMEGYRKSKRKIVTVAINPSNNEFTEIKNTPPYSFCRFHGGEKLWEKDELTADDKELLYSVLNNYFKDFPYNWFNHFEKPLNCLDATYYPDNEQESTAIHIDVQSAIATDPTWGDIKDKQAQNRLSNTALFEQLLEYLKPDIILLSTGRFKEIFGRDIKEDADDYFKNEKEKKGKKDQPIYIAVHRLVVCGRKVVVIAGRNMHGTPFGGFTPGFIKETLNKIKNKPEYRFAFQK